VYTQALGGRRNDEIAELKINAIDSAGKEKAPVGRNISKTLQRPTGLKKQGERDHRRCARLHRGQLHSTLFNRVRGGSSTISRVRKKETNWGRKSLLKKGKGADGKLL